MVSLAMAAVAATKQWGFPLAPNESTDASLQEAFARTLASYTVSHDGRLHLQIRMGIQLRQRPVGSTDKGAYRTFSPPSVHSGTTPPRLALPGSIPD